MSELERTILKSPRREHPRAERLLRRLIKPGERSLYLKADGSLRPCPPLDVFMGETLRTSPGDVLIGAQSDWYHVDIDAIAAEQRRTGLRHVVLCYDIIPILFPQWYLPADAALFRRYYERAFASADRVIFNARSSERDAQDFCRSLGFELTETRIVPLGSDFPVAAGDGSLPAGLEPGRFAVYVSTVEPRKNHRQLVDAWRRLKADGVIDATGFKLVFVGRKGWMMDAFFAELAAEAEFGRSILHLEGASDETIGALYAAAAFSLYPSIYEGYGLPPIESMLVGTPVIASTGGALAEVVGDFGLRLDPADAEAWYREIKRMIEDDGYRRGWAERAKAYRQVTWHEAGERFFAAAAEPFAPRQLQLNRGAPPLRPAYGRPAP